MSGKLIAAIAAAVVLASTGLASAQTRAKAQFHAQEPYAGTVWEGVVPYGSDQMPDRYAGTIWQGVAPY